MENSPSSLSELLIKRTLVILSTLGYNYLHVLIKQLIRGSGDEELYKMAYDNNNVNIVFYSPH